MAQRPFSDNPFEHKRGARTSRTSAGGMVWLGMMFFSRIDLSDAWKSGDRILDEAISLLPNLVLAVVVLGIFVIVASAAKSLVRRMSQRRRRHRNLAVLLGQLTHTTVVLFGFLVSLSVVAPSFHAADLIKMLGVGSVAIGFAFQNILQNFLAGILLLLNEPFQVGDWIQVTGLEGRVEDIQTRATIVTTADQQQIVIPNATLFTNPVVVGEKSTESSVAPPATSLHPPA